MALKTMKTMKTIIIYHRADFDGIFCREIAKKFLPGAELIGWDYGDPVPEILPMQGEPCVYMLDISVEGLMDYPNLVWIDHHKSAIDKYPTGIPGYRIDGVAACRLAWQWFSINQHNAQNATNEQMQVSLPDKEAFVNRELSEPYSVRLAGEYDIWDKRDPDAELFQHGLRSQDLSENMWDLMLVNQGGHPDGVTDAGTITVLALLDAGRAIQYAKTQENESIIKAYGFDVEFEGLKFLACNHARFNSHLFKAATRQDHDALLGFNWDGSKWRVSLYHAPHRTDLDLSAIAVKHGGGGHRGACGFRLQQLPWL